MFIHEKTYGESDVTELMENAEYYSGKIFHIFDSISVGVDERNDHIAILAKVTESGYSRMAFVSFTRPRMNSVFESVEIIDFYKVSRFCMNSFEYLTNPVERLAAICKGPAKDSFLLRAEKVGSEFHIKTKVNGIPAVLITDWKTFTIQ
jgi:hypothetical protein